MSVLVMKMVFENENGLTSLQKLTLLALAFYSNDDGKNIYPSIKNLSIKTSSSERNVTRVLNFLSEEGWIKNETKREGGCAGKTTRWAINLSKLKDDHNSSPSNHENDLGLALPDADETSPYQMLLVDGKDFNVPASYVRKMYECYPAVDVDAEMRKMMAWCISNPRKRKSAGGILRFANEWLRKAQDAAGGGKARGQNLTEGKWSGFSHKNYNEGINEDGSF